MISVIRGRIIFVGELSIVVDVHGIGIELYVPQVHSFSLESEVVLHVYFHWNQEQGPSLFGFESVTEKKVFELIISCSGIGPKLALAILRDLGSTEFLYAVVASDIAALNKVSGIGTKKAEQIIVQLKDKVHKLLSSQKLPDFNASPKTVHLKEISEALSSLGYSRQEITNAVTHLNEQPEHQYIFDQMFRKALSFLARK